MDIGPMNVDPEGEEMEEETEETEETEEIEMIPMTWEEETQEDIEGDHPPLLALTEEREDTEEDLHLMILEDSEEEDHPLQEEHERDLTLEDLLGQTDQETEEDHIALEEGIRRTRRISLLLEIKEDLFPPKRESRAGIQVERLIPNQSDRLHQKEMMTIKVTTEEHQKMND